MGKSSWDYRSIMSGKRKGPVPMLLRGGMRIASGLYGVGVSARNRAFDKGSKDVHRSDAYVISVGNITTGGTGKTPIVCFLAKWFRSRGVMVSIVSRGYGRGESDVNDEALELHDRLPDVPHVQDPDRVEAARVAVEELGSELVLMDDGFQHRRLHRDLNILVVDATCPFGYGHLIPRGLLREPISGIKRADLVIMTRCDLVSDAEVEQIKRQISDIHPGLPVICSNHRPAALFEFPNHESPLESLRGSRIAVVSAIGNPHAFEDTLKGCGAEIIDSRHLPDHDPFSPTTVAELRQWIEGLGDQIEQIVCTHKDLVKLRTDRLGGRPLRALMIELSIVGDREPLEHHLEQAFQQVMTHREQNHQA